MQPSEDISCSQQSIIVVTSPNNQSRKTFGAKENGKLINNFKKKKEKEKEKEK